ALDVADQLLAGCGELGEIVREGGDQRTQGCGCDALARRLELPRREVDAVAVALDRGTRDLDAAAGARAHGIQELLSTDAGAGVPQDDGGALLRMLDVLHGLLQERVGALLHARDAHQPWLAEQRGRGEP